MPGSQAFCHSDMTRILTLLCVCLLGGSVLAQTSWFPTVPDDDPRWRHPVTGARGKGALGDGSEEPPLGPPPPRVTNEVLALATTKPSRIPPGGEGTMVITLMLKGNVVVTPDTAIELTYRTEQKALSLGAYTLRPPTRRMREGPLVGQPVYDQSVILELPLRVAPGANPGKHLATLVAEFELKDSTHGISKGRWLRGVKTQVQVGDSRQLARGAPGPLPRGSSAPASEPSEPRGSGPRFGTPVLGGNGVGKASTEPADAGVTEPRLPSVSLQAPLVLWVFLGCGALALTALVVLLLSRLFRLRGTA